jgi:hypothetical protein
MKGKSFTGIAGRIYVPEFVRKDGTVVAAHYKGYKKQYGGRPVKTRNVSHTDPLFSLLGGDPKKKWVKVPATAYAATFRRHMGTLVPMTDHTPKSRGSKSYAVLGSGPDAISARPNERTVQEVPLQRDITVSVPVTIRVVRADAAALRKAVGNALGVVVLRP